MSDLIVDGGTVVTMDAERTVVEDGAVVVEGREIVDVGTAERITDEYDAGEWIDATDHAVLPGFISAHAHVAGILLRGLGNYRGLYDWLVNVKRPGTSVMTGEEHAVAAATYAREALQSGITTFVENATGSAGGYGEDLIERKMAVYDAAGVRNVYAYAFADEPPTEEYIEDAASIAMGEPEVDSVIPDETVADTAESLDTVEGLIERYHGTADGRQSVWPGPFLAWGVSPEGLAGAYELAEAYDVMTTTHTAESPKQERHLESSVEYLESADYLGERTLLGHCVQVSDADVRRLAETDTRVAHNVVTNCSLGSGVAPVPAMRQQGVTVGLGTDNIDQNDTVNMVSDMRVGAMVHKAAHEDPAVVTAEDLLEMATIDAARAIGRGEQLGSLEPGKLADVVALDLDRPHLLPHTDAVSTLVYQAQGTEITTVVCNGEVVVEDRALAVDAPALPDSREAVFDRAAELAAESGIDSLE